MEKAERTFWPTQYLIKELCRLNVMVIVITNVY